MFRNTMSRDSLEKNQLSLELLGVKNQKVTREVELVTSHSLFHELVQQDNGTAAWNATKC